MNTKFEDRLRSDMRRFTRDVRVPPGLARQACRHNRKRRKTLRVAVASGATAAVAAGAVAIAGASGAFGSSAPTSRPIQTTAFVLRHVENALAPSSVGSLIDFSRTVFPPGTPQEPVVGGLNGGSTNGASSPWIVAHMLHWDYQGSQRYSAYSPSGQHVFDMGMSIGNGSATQTTVIYGKRTWWTATVAVGVPGSPGCTQSSIELGNGWPAFIRSQLACGAYTVAGDQVVDGIDAIKITGSAGRLTLFVDQATYLPIQLDMGPLRISFRWLPATPANLAHLKVSVPAGFRQVPPPTQN